MIEVTAERLRYTRDYYELTVQVNDKELIMHVTVCEGAVESVMESDKTRQWNRLTFDEKHQVQEEILHYRF